MCSCWCNLSFYQDGRLKVRSARLTAAASAKQKLSTRFQPQRKPPHRLVQANSVKRAKTFSLGGSGGGGAAGHLLLQPAAYKTLPKQASSRSLGSTSSSTTDSSQGSQSTASSRKSSDSSNLSDSGSAASPPDISPEAMNEIAAFEKFIEKYFQNCENNNNNNNSSSSRHNSNGRPPKGGKTSGGRIKPKVSAGSSLAEVLELSI